MDEDGTKMRSEGVGGGCAPMQLSCEHALEPSMRWLRLPSREEADLDGGRARWGAGSCGFALPGYAPLWQSCSTF